MPLLASESLLCENPPKTISDKMKPLAGIESKPSDPKSSMLLYHTADTDFVSD